MASQLFLAQLFRVRILAWEPISVIRTIKLHWIAGKFANKILQYEK